MIDIDLKLVFDVKFLRIDFVIIFFTHLNDYCVFAALKYAIETLNAINTGVSFHVTFPVKSILMFVTTSLAAAHHRL